MSESEPTATGVAQVWSRPQHAVAYQEARAVLNSQQQRKVNLDDKALRTAQLATVIVGALITVAKAFDIEVVGPVGSAGIVLLVVSFGAALAAYSVPGPILGPGASGLEELLKSDEQWEQMFLSQLDAAIEMNATWLDQSSSLLLVSDVTLFAGVIATLSAIAL
jgi:hypothetical protein